MNVLKNVDIVSLLDGCFDVALKSSVSDIHIETKQEFVVIKFRIDGVLSIYKQLSLELGPQLFSRLKVLINGDITKRNTPQEGRFSMGDDRLNGIDLRVVIVPTVLGEKAVLRILNRKDLMLKLSELGMHQSTYQHYKEMLASRQGLILVCGATGSGKTTTMYASLMEVNADERHIITVEDPVEYIVDGINQIQVNKDAGLAMSSALKYILRMDPDVVFVGEIRDTQTASLACSAALTGHLVVATIHTNDSLSAITRLYDMGIEPFMIAHSLKGVVSQVLMPKMCDACGGEGCDSCSSKGFKGRRGVFELMVINKRLRERIISPPYSISELEDYAREGFYQTIKEEAALKLKENTISSREYHLLSL